MSKTLKACCTTDLFGLYTITKVMRNFNTLRGLTLILYLSSLQLAFSHEAEESVDGLDLTEDTCRAKSCESNSKVGEAPSTLSNKIEDELDNLATENVAMGGYQQVQSELPISSDIKNDPEAEASYSPYHVETVDVQSVSSDPQKEDNINKLPQSSRESVSPSTNEQLSDENEFIDAEDFEPVFPQLEVIGAGGKDNSVNNDNDVDSGEKDDRATKDNMEQEGDTSSSRRRFFPLLYTFRTLFSSFLSEFGDEGASQDGTFNTSGTAHGNMTNGEELLKDLNVTINGTDSGRKTRFQCAAKNITANIAGKVKIVNSTELLEILNSSKNQKMSTCILVMFYAPWCHFCARAAPHYNALARAFPQLDVLAVDTSHFSYLNARFGTVAVPNVMLFHARSAVRFNHTVRALDNFIQFVNNNTGLEPDKHVKLEPKDFLGPLPSVVVRSRDWLLWLAWAFVTVCSTYGFVRSRYGQSFITRLRVLWQEHQHIE